MFSTPRKQLSNVSNGRLRQQNSASPSDSLRDRRFSPSAHKDIGKPTGETRDVPTALQGNVSHADFGQTVSEFTVTPPKRIPTELYRADKENYDTSFGEPGRVDRPEDVELLQGDNQKRAHQTPQTRIAYLRVKLKAWEKQFEANNGGRKAGKDDIRKNASVAARYREYHRLRSLTTQEPPVLDFGVPKINRKRENDQSSDLGFSTPKARRTTSKAREGPSSQGSANTDEDNSPSSRIPAFVGPTPQRNGRVLGLFDLLSPSKRRVEGTPTRTPKPTTLLVPGSAAAPLPEVSTPKRQRQDDEDETECWTGRANRRQRTPASEGKRFHLSMFVTPSKRSRLGLDPVTELDDDPYPSISRQAGVTTPLKGGGVEVRVDTTPSVLRRESSVIDRSFQFDKRQSLSRQGSAAGVAGAFDRKGSVFNDGLQSNPGSRRTSMAAVLFQTTVPSTPTMGSLTARATPGGVSFSEAVDDGDIDAVVEDTLLDLEQDEALPQALRDAIRSGSTPGRASLSLETIPKKPSARVDSVFEPIEDGLSGAVIRPPRLPFGAGTRMGTFSMGIRKMRESEIEQKAREEQERVRKAIEDASRATAQAYGWGDEDEHEQEEMLRMELEREAEEEQMLREKEEAATLEGERSDKTNAKDNDPQPVEDIPLFTSGDQANECDRFDDNLEEIEFDAEPENQGTFRVRWKKKGQKRTTRLVRMKPAVRKGPVDEPEDESSEDDSDPEAEPKAKEPQPEPEEGKKKPRKKTHNPNAISNQNYRRLQIKDRGAKKGRQWGRGGRR